MCGGSDLATGSSGITLSRTTNYMTRRYPEPRYTVFPLENSVLTIRLRADFKFICKMKNN